MKNSCRTLLAALVALPLASFTPPAQAPQQGAGPSLAGVNATTNASGTPRNGGTNPSSLTMVLPPVIGAAMVGRLDFASTGHPLGFVTAYLTPLNFTLPSGQTLLVNIADPAGVIIPPFPVDPFSQLFAYPIPPDNSLCGITLSMQGVHYDALLQLPIVLSNALDLTLGN